MNQTYVPFKLTQPNLSQICAYAKFQETSDGMVEIRTGDFPSTKQEW
jgi:hypothetical protein